MVISDHPLPPFADDATPFALRVRRTRAWLPTRLDDGTWTWLAPIEVTDACYLDGVWNSGEWRRLSTRRLGDGH